MHLNHLQFGHPLSSLTKLDDGSILSRRVFGARAFQPFINPVIQVPRGYIDGLITATSASIYITYSAGICRDSTDVATLVSTAGMAKRIDGNWTAGNTQYGLDTGTRAANTWYHYFIISNSDGSVTDGLISLSPTAPTMPTGYTLKRRVASIKTDGSSNIIGYVQNGDEFLWSDTVNDVAATNPGTTAVTRTLNVPTGIKVKAIIYLVIQGTDGAGQSVYLSDLDSSDIAPDHTQGNGFTYGTGPFGSQLSITGSTTYVWTNTSAQCRTRNQFSDGTTIIYITSMGWIDPRGKAIR